jgi:hypothetical protein
VYIYYDAALSVLLPLSKWLREDPLLLVPSAMAEPSGKKKRKKTNRAGYNSDEEITVFFFFFSGRPVMKCTRRRP